MSLCIAGHVIDPEGTAQVGVDVLIAFDNAASFADLGGDWDTQGRYGLAIPTDTFGAWSWTVPFSAIDPSTATCSITLPNGVRWSGLLPLSHNGTLSLKDLKDSYSWGLVSLPSASVVAVQGIAGAAGASGTSLPGVTSDEADGVAIQGNLSVGADGGVSGDFHVIGTVHTNNAATTGLVSVGGLVAGPIASIGTAHDGHIGGNATTYGVATQDNGSFVAGKVFQQIPSGVTIPANAVLTLNMGAGDAVSVRAAQGTFPFIYFVPDNGSGAPDFSGGPGSFHFTSPILTPGLSVGTTVPYYYRAEAQIDDTWWLAVSVGSDAPTDPFLLLDADTATVDTWTGTQFNGSDAVDAGAQPHIYLAYASDKGFAFTAFDGTPLATLFTNGLLVNGGLGSHGVTPQASPRTLAQSVITAITDANAKTAMQATADALADIGALTIT